MAALPPPAQRRRPGRLPLPGRPGLPARRSSSIAAASCSASRHSSATGAAVPGCPQRSPELSALSRDSAERRVMGGGGGRGPARTQVGGCRQERAPLIRRGIQRCSGRMVPAPSPGAACERRESVVSGEPRESRSRRRACFWRSRFGTSQHPEEGPAARDHLPAERGRDISSSRRPACPRLLSTGTRRRRQPEVVVSLYRKGEPADAPLPRLGQASPAGSSGNFREGGSRGGEPCTQRYERGRVTSGAGQRSQPRRCPGFTLRWEWTVRTDACQ